MDLTAISALSLEERQVEVHFLLSMSQRLNNAVSSTQTQENHACPSQARGGQDTPPISHYTVAPLNQLEQFNITFQDVLRSLVLLPWYCKPGLWCILCDNSVVQKMCVFPKKWCFSVLLKSACFIICQVVKIKSLIAYDGTPYLA